MACPKCGAEVGGAEWQTPTRGALARATLLDWRTWALAFVVMALSGLVAGALDLGGAAGAGGGAAVGMLIALRMGRLRRCPKCESVVTPPS